MYHIDSKSDKPDIKYLSKRVNEMMARGIAVAQLQVRYSKFIGERDFIATDIQNCYGISNPNSSQQIAKYLASLEDSIVYDVCFINGKWTSNKESMAKLAELGYQFAIDILQYRKAKKYAESIKSMSDAISSDGRVHPIVSLSKTNRINYSSPALMNIPKPLLWHMIKPLNNDNILISADIKNQEPNILINMLNAEELKPALTAEEGLYENLFSQPFKPTATLNIIAIPGYKEGIMPNSELANMDGIDPCFYTPKLPPVSTCYYNGERVRYIDVTNVVVTPGNEVEIPNKILIETIDEKQHMVDVEWESYDGKRLNTPGYVTITGFLPGIEVRCEGVARNEFKIAWNAMTYGASSFGIDQMCKNIDGKAVYKYFSKIKAFSDYRKACTKLANNGIQTISTYFGTGLFAGEADSSKLKRVLLDLPVQGTASDILSLLIKHADKEIESRGLTDKLYIYYTRHDEIIFEVDREWADFIGMEEVKGMILDIVEHQVDDWVPFKVEVKEVKADRLYIDTDNPFDE